MVQRDACLASPANAVELSANRRMPFGPDLLSQELEDGRFGNFDDRGYLSQATERERNGAPPALQPARYIDGTDRSSGILSRRRR